MGHLDVYAMPGGAQPFYVVDVQADLLSHLATSTVLPLLPRDSAPDPISELIPVLDVAGVPHVLVTQAIAAIPRRELKHPVASMATDRDRITRALDTLLIGF